MNSIFDFIKAYIEDVLVYDNDVYPFQEEVAYVSSADEVRSNCDNDNYFESQRQMIEYISKLAAQKYYDNNCPIHDKYFNVIDDLDKIDELLEGFPFYVNKLGLEAIGINSFGIKDDCSDNAVFINIEHISNIIACTAIENYIFSCCIDDIIKELSQKSAYRCYKKENTVVGDLIMYDKQIANINSITQLKMFVYESMNRNMRFLEGKIKTLHTNDVRVNIQSDNIPQTIEINYILERTWCAPGYECEIDDYFIVRSVKYRVVQNIDWSLSLFPDPSDVQKLISEQMNLWKQCTNDIYGDWWFPPTTMRPLIEFMKKNKYSFNGRYIDKIVTYEEAEKMTIDADNKEFDDCFIGDGILIQISDLPEEKYYDYISTYDQVLVILK